MCTYFNTKTDVAQNLIDDFFFLTLDCPLTNLSIGRILSEKKYGGMGLIFEKTDVLYVELIKRVEPATCSYSGTGYSLQYIYSLPVFKNHQNIQSR